jgi:hypothetical protein
VNPKEEEEEEEDWSVLQGTGTELILPDIILTSGGQKYGLRKKGAFLLACA